MMELNHFSDENFSAKNWVNNTLGSLEDNGSENVIQHAFSLVAKIEMAIQNINNRMEEASVNIVSNLPRVLRDVDALSHESSFLRNQMKHIKTNIEKVECSTATSMQTLVQLDAVKSRLRYSLKDLKEVDNWATISSDIEQVMEEGDLDKISRKLIALHNCLSILSHVPDYEERISLLEGLKVRLESLVSPRLVAAFGVHDLGESMKYSKILIALGRSKNLESYYEKCETQQMNNEWRSIVESADMNGPPIWLSSFFEKLFLLISKQIKWCGDVFEFCNPYFLLARLTKNILSSLDPPITEVVSIAIKRHNEPLLFLEEVRKAGNAFLKDYYQVFSLYSDDSSIGSLNEDVIRIVYAPVKDQILHYYRDYEESFFLSHLISADVIQEDLMESIKLLKNYGSQLTNQTESALQRCIQVTDGFAFPSLVSAVVAYFTNYCDRLSQVTRKLEQMKIYIEDDWSVFNSYISLIQVSGNFLMAVESTERSFITALTNISCEFSSRNSNIESGEFNMNIVFSEAEMKQLISLFSKCFEKNESLLPNSCLGEAELQCKKSVEVTLSVIIEPIIRYLSTVSQLPAWKKESSESSHLSASFSPQEYITQIGQYLMTLPQHLEPLLLECCPFISKALQMNDEQTKFGDEIVSKGETNAAHSLISRVVESTCSIYVEALLKIHEIRPGMIVQLTTDIDYICNIFEDLGICSSDPLDKLNVLLKAPVENYWNVVPGNNPRLVAAVRQMRNIPAKS